MDHSISTANHIPWAAAYADAAARTAATGFERQAGGGIIPFGSNDVGKCVRQIDDNSVWMLTDDSPATWIQITGGGGVPSLTSGSVVFSGGGATLSQDNARYFWSSANHQLIIRHDGGSAVARTDAALEIQGTDGFISCLQTSNPGNTTNETGIAFFAYDSAGGIKKTHSISSKWGSANSSTGYGVARHTLSYNGDANEIVMLKLYGNAGIRIHGGDNATPPGTNILSVEGLGIAIPSGGTLTQGATSPDASFGFKGLHDGSQVSSSTDYISHGFLNAAGSKGIYVGYDSGSQLGTITSAGTTSGISMWTHNGSAYAERFRVNTAGNTSAAGSFTQGAATADAAYGIKGLSDGSQVASSTDYIVHAFLKADSSKGIYLGYDSGSQLGTITSVGTTSGVAIWTHNGSAYAERMRVHTNGFVGINTASPGSALGLGGSLSLDISSFIAFQGATVAASSSNYSLYGDATNTFINTPTGGAIHLRVNNVAKFVMSSAGNFTWANYGAGTLTTDASGNVTAVSDARLKNIQDRPFEYGLNELRSIKPIFYKWRQDDNIERDTDNVYLGFTTQNIKETIPEAVFEGPDGYQSLWERGIICTMVKAIQELEQMVQQLKGNLNVC